VGYFLVFEGPDGSGKSTQARLLADALEADGYRTVRVREPGGTRIGERVRDILMDHAHDRMLAETEALLFAAARAQLVGEVIRPALDAGAVVVCDRFVDSSLAYQVGGRGLRREDVGAIQQLATGGLRPDLRVLLDLPVEVGLRRRYADSPQVNRLDAADRDFHERVRACYWTLAGRDPDGWLVLDAERPTTQLAAEILALVEPRLRECTVGRGTATTNGGGE
jgi:dTMP kinase